MGEAFEAILDNMAFGRFHWKIFLSIGMFCTMDSIEVNMINLVAPRLKCEWKLNEAQVALSTSTLFLGTAVGHAYWGWIGDRKGRKSVLLASSMLALYYGVITAASESFYLFLLLHFFACIGVGGAGSAMCYLMEFNSTSLRARIGVMTGAFFAFGSLFACFICYIAMNALGWRYFLVLCAVPLPLVIALVLCLPESIRYLQVAGKLDAAMKVLRVMSTEKTIPSPTHLNADRVASAARGRIKDLFSTIHVRKTWVLCILWITSFFAYYGIVLMNTQMLKHGIFRKGNKTTTSDCHPLKDEDYLQNLIVSVGEIPALIVCVLLIENMDRRYCLIIFNVITGIFLITLGFSLTPVESTVVLFITRGTAAAAVQIMHVYTLELFPTTVRNTGLGFCTAIGRIFLILLPFLVDMLVITVFRVLPLTLGIAVIVSSLLLCLLPDTRGIRLSNR